MPLRGYSSTNRERDLDSLSSRGATRFSNLEVLSEMLKSVKASVVAACLLSSLLSSADAEDAIRRVGLKPTIGSAAAVTVSGRSLVQTTQLFPHSGGQSGEVADLKSQFDSLMKRLEGVLRHAGSAREHVVKVNFYVANVEAADYIRANLRGWFGDEALPAVSYVQTRLPVEQASMALDAVAASDPISNDQPTHGHIAGIDTRGAPSSYSVMPLGDVIYVARTGSERRLVSGDC